ncbi:hypothetical protein CHS0354_000386 [Potamilus streckersoni]|uniref:Leucine-rich repeat and IQ domain-containing protein 3 n=1 Tax=Potamilus streckersoni TaxID=2493646 RepID=A0AAE0SNC7_9BIVA|nr:hypothetical protein CHS0354_000386 [Potamilus streckersoni]
MVSFPEWSKFQRVNDGLQKEGSSLSNLERYHKLREDEVIQQAEAYGMLRTPSQHYLLQTCAIINGPKIRDVSQLLMVKLCGVHLRKIGDINLCVNLKICILSNNFITKFDGLAECKQLVKLDLHGNQITTVPGVTFWSGLRHLRFLHLHDNPIGKYDSLQSLSMCPHLVILTMYDTPLSLKRNYRHHVVNSIWSLRALDYHVISDEEIIEDAVFGGKFVAKNPNLRIKLHSNTPSDYTFAEEMELIRAIESRVNNIMAHYSPVLILQRYARGYLTRKRLDLSVGKSRSRTRLPVIASDLVPPPPSSSPAFGHTSHEHDISVTDGVTVDYDTYMKNRRPNSTVPSEATSYNRHIPGGEAYLGPLPTPLEGMFDEHDTISAMELTADGIPKKKKNLLINLAKLETGPFSSLLHEQIATETFYPSLSKENTESAISLKKRRKKKKEKPVRKVKSVSQFFGPVVDSTPTPEPDEKPSEEEEAPITQYRLKGFKPTISYIDPVAEMILTKQEAGRLIRDAENDHHRRLQDVQRPKLPPRKFMSSDQRIFNRMHGTMGLSCLYAVHQAYKDREKAERTAAKMEYIMNLREERDRAKERIKLFNEEKRNHTLKQRDISRAKMLDALEKREMQRLNYFDRKQEFRSKSHDLTKSYKEDFTFITEFSTQHTSVSNALMRHDRQAKCDDTVQQKTDLVKSMKVTEGEQQEVVKKYMEHRILMRQTESAMARAALDTRMLQEANDRVIEAKSRVAQQRARQETVQAFYPLPQMTPVPLGSSAHPVIAHGITRWEANALTYQGRIGKHQTVVT